MLLMNVIALLCIKSRIKTSSKMVRLLRGSNNQSTDTMAILNNARKKNTIVSL